jgi:hypothetical protein
MQKAHRGIRKWLSVRMERNFSKDVIGALPSI